MNESDSVEVQTPVGKLRAFGATVICSLLGFGICVGMTLLWTTSERHEAATTQTMANVAVSLNELAKAQRQQNEVIRKQTCLLSLPLDKREREFFADNGVCNALSRMQ